MGGKRTILVVDDVPDEIAVLEEILKRDYQVKAVTSGSEALAVARGPSPPDLVLLDILMPDMDGFEVCRALRQDGEGASLPVVFLTAKGGKADERMGFGLGAVDYIRKPVDPEILLNRVAAQLGQKDRILRLSEMKYRRLFETAQDGIAVVDVGSGAILDANPALARLMGASQEAFLGKGLGDLDFIRTLVELRSTLPVAARDRPFRQADRPLETFDGRRIFVECVCGVYQADGREVMQIKLRDITELVEAERERDRLASRLSHYLSTSPTVTYAMSVSSGRARFVWMSDNVEAVLGYRPEEAMAPDWWFGKVSALDRGRLLDLVAELAKSGSESREYRFAAKDGRTVWLHDEMRLLPGEGEGPEIVGTLTDVTRRREAEEEVRLKGSALEAAANAVVITDRSGRIKWANRAYAVLSGYSLAESLGLNPRELVRSGAQDEAFYRSMWDTILGGKVWSGKLVNRRKSGELYDEEMTITPVLDEEREISHFIAVKTDVTEAELSRRKLEQALREREALLREIHHRVNNNMQVIVSLVNLCARNVEDAGALPGLAELAQRIHAMAAVHELFYQSEDMARIDFGEYLRRLAAKLGSEFGEAVEVRASSERVSMSLETAVPAGLIVGELLSRAAKRAFPGPGGGGRVGVSLALSPEGEAVVSVVAEGGEAAEGAGEEGELGRLLVDALSGQVDARVSYGGEGGSIATLRIRLPHYNQTGG